MLIYKITNLINGLIYIGKIEKEDKTIEQRFAEHIFNANRWKKCQELNIEFGYRTNLYPAMCEFGYDNFSITVLEDKIETINLLNIREQYWISLLDTQNPNIGYNIANGGSGGATRTGAKLSDATKQKISTGNKLAWQNEISKQQYMAAFSSDEFKQLKSSQTSGVNNPMYGKHFHHTEEAKKKISEHNAKTMLGKHHSDESKQKISLKNKGRIPPNKGVHHTDETKQKISVAKQGQVPPNKGVPCSLETKAKISAANKGKHLYNYYGCASKEDYLATHNNELPISAVAKKIICVETGEIFNSISAAVSHFHIGAKTIREILKGERSSIKGYSFKYFIEETN